MRSWPAILAGTLVAWSGLDDAQQAYATAEGVGVRPVLALHGRFNVALLHER